MLDSIYEWLTGNALAIIISGIVSLIISKYYFDKANHESVLMTIIFPIVKILDSRYYTKSNYEALFKINASYASKHLKRRERNKLLALLSSYRNVCRYTQESADTDCIMSYYNCKLEENDINPKPCAITDDEGNYIDDDFPPDYNLLEDQVYKIVSSYEFVQSPMDCTKQIAEAFEIYTKKYYTNKKIAFFDDYPIEKVIEMSLITHRWKDKFELAEKCKADFLNLSICKRTTKIISQSSVNEYDQKIQSDLDENNSFRDKIYKKMNELKDVKYSSIYVVICFVEQVVILEALKDLTSLILDENAKSLVYIVGGTLSFISLLLITSVLIKHSRKQIESDAKRQIECGEESTHTTSDKMIECATTLGYLSPLVFLGTMISGLKELLLLKWGIIVLVHILGIGLPLLIRKK